MSVNVWLWLLVVIVAWIAVSVPVALLLGRVVALREASTESAVDGDAGVDRGRQRGSSSADSADPFRPLVITETVPQKWVDEVAEDHKIADGAAGDRAPEADPARPLIITSGVPQEWVTRDAEARSRSHRPPPHQ